MKRKWWIKRAGALSGVLIFSLAGWNVSAQAAESPALFQEQAQEQGFFVPGEIKTEIGFGDGKKDLGMITIPGQDVGVRAFFEKFT